MTTRPLVVSVVLLAPLRTPGTPIHSMLAVALAIAVLWWAVRRLSRRLR